ncbi:MAG TPA: lytic transglycosylase domain-containing protein [Bacteroidia bacterium]|nr:lytic transglycosylase domain-containing protein [Bacteroidia bacterium]
MQKRSNDGLRNFFSKYRSGTGAVMLGAFVFFIVYVNSLNDLTPPLILAQPQDSSVVINNIKIPPLTFCGEPVPTSDPEVRRRLTEEFLHITFNQSPFLILNKKAHRWFPMIEPILKKNGVPDDFKYVMVIESGLINSPDQPKAGGFWQLMPPVARQYGLEVNDAVDERFNVTLETEAACRCIKDAYAHYKNWTLAVAAYDLGTGGLDAQIGKQDATDYYHLKLNEETASYIYRILAFKELLTEPEYYGYKLKKNSLYSPIPTHQVKVDSTIHDLGAFAVSQGSDLQTLKWLNPWILGNSLPNDSAKTYCILFPSKGFVIYGMNEDYNPNDNDSVILDSVIVKTDTLISDSARL